MRQGERPNRHRSWTQTPRHRGPQEPGLKASTGVCEPTEAAWRARETRERRNWGGGTGGQLLVAKPVTSPDSARATELRKPEAVAGTATRCALGQRRRGAGASASPKKSRRESRGAQQGTLQPRGQAEGTTEGAAVAAGTEGEPAAEGPAERPEPAGPITLERPSAMESSSAASTES